MNGVGVRQSTTTDVGGDRPPPACRDAIDSKDVGNAATLGGHASRAPARPLGSYSVKIEALRVFAPEIDPYRDCAATFTTAGLPERELRRALASFARRIVWLDPEAALWVAAAREQDSELGPTAWHAHGLLRTVVRKRDVDTEWRGATRGHGHGGRSIKLVPFDDAKGGVLGWLGYSTREATTTNIVGRLLAAGSFASPWAWTTIDCLSFPIEKTCAWCFAVLSSPRQRFCRRLCKAQATRARRRRANSASTSLRCGQ